MTGEEKWRAAVERLEASRVDLDDRAATYVALAAAAGAAFGALRASEMMQAGEAILRDRRDDYNAATRMEERAARRLEVGWRDHETAIFEEASLREEFGPDEDEEEPAPQGGGLRLVKG